MISVVVPLYNKEEVVERTIRSVLNQTWVDFELLVVNDGSSDRSVEIVESIIDRRIKVIHQANQGVSVARNRGVQEAQHELIAFLDADDEWMPDYLEKQFDLFQQYPKCQVSACMYLEQMPDGEQKNIRYQGFHLPTGLGVLTNYFEVACISRPPITSSSVMVLKNALKEIGGFPIGVGLGEDILTWAKLAARFEIAYRLEPKVIIHLNETHLHTSRNFRKPDENTIVEDELKKLISFSDSNKKKAIKRYLAHWYKMRTSVYLRFGCRGLTIRYALKSLSLNPSNWKVAGMLILAFFPTSVQFYLRKKFAL